jgi:hypothetical protein
LVSGCALEKDELERLDDQGCTSLEAFLDIESNQQFHLINIDGKGIMTWITEKVSSVMNSAVSKIYMQIAGEEVTDADGNVTVQNNDFRILLGTMMTLAIMFYAIAIMFGIAQASGYSIVMFILKLFFIYNFAINYDLFKEYVIDTIEAAISDIIMAVEGTFHDYEIINSGSDGDEEGNQTSPLFGEIDKVLSYLWDFKMMTLMLGLIPSGYTGFFWALLLLLLIFLYTFAIIFAVKVFLLALIARFVLYALAPIFLSLALFNQTKSLFDGYIEQLMNFALQPIFLFIFLGMFHMLLAGFLNEIYIDNLTGDGGTGEITGDEFKLCWRDIVTVGTKPLYWPQICKIQKDKAESCSANQNTTKSVIPIDIWVLISCVIICYLMYSMLGWVTEVAAKLSAGLITVSDIPIQGFDKVQSAIGATGSGMWQRFTSGFK